MSGVPVAILTAAAMTSAVHALELRTAEDRLGLQRQHGAITRVSFGDLTRWRGAPFAAAALGAAFGVLVAGWVGGAIGAVAAFIVPPALRRRGIHRRAASMETQLADLTGAMALAVRSGLSAARALHAAADDAEAPLAEALRALVEAERVGEPFERALDRFAREVGSDDARLFALVVDLHAKTGGDLARALDEVSQTIRHRVGVRRDLRALSAQGRISGTVLGVLPVGFFLVLALTSRRELTAVVGTPAGAAMVIAGLVLEGLAFLWIRRLLRVEA